MACPGQLPYTEPDIQVLEGLEPIRRRPGMYIGDTGPAGLFHLLLELVTESLAETVAGHGRSVRVALRADGTAEVADNGRVPPDVGLTFGHYPHGHGYHLPGSGRGDFSYVVANALSERLSAVARTDGSAYQHVWHRGVTHTAVQMGGPPDACGLTVAFKPDPDIFGTAQFDATTIRDRLRELAFLHSGVRITFADEATGTSDVFEYADGIRESVTFLNADRRPLHADVILIRGEERGVRYEVGLQWCEDDGTEVRQSFANHYHTRHGGTHERGLQSGVSAGLHDFMREHAPQPGELRSGDLRTGLTAGWCRFGFPNRTSRARFARG